MQDTNPNSPENDSGNNSGNKNDNKSKYELISSYIDNELSDNTEKEVIKKLIETDNDFYNRYIFEKLTKENLRKRSVRIETPVYIYKNIGQEIDNYIKKASVNNSISNQTITNRFIAEENIRKSNLKRNLIAGSFAFLFLIVAAFLLNNILKQNPELRDNDLVAVSRNIFDKVQKGQVSLKFNSGNSKELSDSMNKYLDFRVYIPDVKDAILIGGVCNEINEQKLAHFIHKKGTIIIYTLQASKEDVMRNKDKIILCDQYKENVNSGKNWIPCSKESHKTVVVWYKDNVICSSVADMDYDEISNTLSNNK